MSRGCIDFYSILKYSLEISTYLILLMSTVFIDFSTMSLDKI